MRLICPNCDAQYEVVDDVIPKDGRDVQCSNCGQTWYQNHPDHPPAAPATPDLPPDLAEPDDSPAPGEERVETEAASEKAPAPEPAQRGVDPSVAGILREEAARETQARAASSGLETQPDLGLEAGETTRDRRAREAQERTARLRGEDPIEEAVAATATAAAVTSRRELLPDIEEINSTLRSSNDREPRVADPGPDPDETAPKRSGFRRGFFLMIVLALILGGIYVFAPQIAQALPQADPYLSAYVAQVDTARAWLDGQVAKALEMLDAAAAESG